jgi:DUF4097 and DUF4098 domain-containing protein YvlB
LWKNAGEGLASQRPSPARWILEKNVIRLIFALMIFIPLCGCLVSAEESEEFYETYTVEPDTDLLVSNYQAGGDVSVSKWDEDYVEVYATKKTRQGLENVRIEVSVDGSVHIQTKLVEREVMATVSYEIKVPPTVTGCYIYTANGDIWLQGTRGDAALETTIGAIFARDVDGYISAITSSGGIFISGSAGILEARTGDGDIEAEVRDVKGDWVPIETNSGSIKLYISDNLDARIDMIIRTTGIGLEAGRISIHDVRLSGFHEYKSTVGTFAGGQMGDGSSHVYIQTQGGDIDLYRLRSV